MKRFLLSAALGVMALGVSAQTDTTAVKSGYDGGVPFYND